MIDISGLVKKMGLFSLVLCFLSCSTQNKKQLDRQEDSTSTVLKTSSKSVPATLGIDSTLMKEYRQHLDSCDTRTAEFIHGLIPLMYRFAARQLDTSLLVVGQLDGLGNPDTVQTRIYMFSDSIIVESRWIRSGDTLWQFRLANPYLWIDNSHLFEPDTRSPWVTFAIGVLYAKPDLEPIDNNSTLKRMAVDNGLRDLRAAGMPTSRVQYQSFLDGFKGQLISYGDPENREGLMIWYEPAKRFLLFYAP